MDALNGTQQLSFKTIKNRKPIYLDARNVFPIGRSLTSESEPELLPEEPEEILKKAIKLSKEQPILFWGESNIYHGFSAWPKLKDLQMVSLSIRVNAKKFFEDLQAATSGFYFLEAYENQDLEYLRGVNYRSKHYKGICLILAQPFMSKSDYLQALGRVRRGADEGEVYVLQTPMYPGADK